MSKLLLGVLAGLAALTALWWCVWVKFGDVRDFATERSGLTDARSLSNTQRIGQLESEIVSSPRPASISIEWLGEKHVRMSAETGPGEKRRAFNAEVMAMYQDWSKEIK